MTFSARSLAECRRSSRLWRSSSGVAPRGRVPLIGRVSTFAVLDAQEALRRGAGDDEIAEIEVAGERGRVALAQPAVQFQRVHVGPVQQALRQVDLEAIAGVDVFDGAADGLQVAGPVEVAGDAFQTRKRIETARIDNANREPHPPGWRRGGRLCQQTPNAGEPLRRPPIALPRVAFGKAGGDDPGPPLGVVKRDYPVIKADGQVRRLELVAPRPRQALDVMAQVVAEQPRRPALKRRQAANRFRSIGRQPSGQRGKRIALPAPTIGVKYDPSTRRKPAERLRRHERVTAQRRVVGGAVQKQDIWEMR